VTGYVLSRPDAGDEALIRDSIGDATDVLPAVLSGDLGAAMKQLHTVASHGI
jgi:peptidyl-tRNA hydrolase